MTTREITISESQQRHPSRDPRAASAATSRSNHWGVLRQTPEKRHGTATPPPKRRSGEFQPTRAEILRHCVSAEERTDGNQHHTHGDGSGSGNIGYQRLGQPPQAASSALRQRPPSRAQRPGRGPIDSQRTARQEERAQDKQTGHPAGWIPKRPGVTPAAASPTNTAIARASSHAGKREARGEGQPPAKVNSRGARGPPPAPIARPTTRRPGPLRWRGRRLRSPKNTARPFLKAPFPGKSRKPPAAPPPQRTSRSMAIPAPNPKDQLGRQLFGIR